MAAWAVASIISWRVKNGASPQGKAEVATKPHGHYFKSLCVDSCAGEELFATNDKALFASQFKGPFQWVFLHIVSVDNYNNTANHNLKHANQTINFLHIPDIHYSL